ncbi:unnamed protein product [Rangifer tarandus platyrhynchus]|uniref:Uncharacterized protein n=1 Tax=Rangifer tarandus platyrhynchus TaxID=3082113 RepID=A0AC59YLL3_RANTA
MPRQAAAELWKNVKFLKQKISPEDPVRPQLQCSQFFSVEMPLQKTDSAAEPAPGARPPALCPLLCRPLPLLIRLRPLRLSDS